MQTLDHTNSRTMRHTTEFQPTDVEGRCCHFLWRIAKVVQGQTEQVADSLSVIDVK